MASAIRPTSTRSWWYRNGVIVAALVVVVVGSVIFLLAPTTVPLYGWTAYTPLSSTPDVTMTSYLTHQHLVGAATTVLEDEPLIEDPPADAGRCFDSAAEQVVFPAAQSEGGPVRAFRRILRIGPQPRQGRMLKEQSVVSTRTQPPLRSLPVTRVR